MKKNLSKALADLDAAFENLEVQPLTDETLGRALGATDYWGCACPITSVCTGDLCNTSTVGVTCNVKCGPTRFWECGPEFTAMCQC